MPYTIDKIIGVGKNYLEHARELGDAIPEKPVLFLKPPSILKTVSHWNDTLALTYPAGRSDLHHEIELVLQISRDGYQLTAQQAADSIKAVTIGLDMTLRAEQAKLKEKGHPWTTAKVFVDSAITGPWIPLKEFPDYLTTEFTLEVDGQMRQKGAGQQMTMQPIEIVQYISQFFPLCAGDIIFTGTPAGVGPVHAGSKATLCWGNYSYHVAW